ncbi:MAG: hypothetical protein RMJ98_02535 [Myxococcales bacterium]|nr:hypothetical protein [Myxococcales bacterium]
MVFLRRRSWCKALLVAFGFSLAGCASPTLPLPPPEPPVVGSFHEDGTVTLKGSAQPEAIVYAFNQTLEVGVIGKASALGTYILRLQAAEGHEVAVWQEVGSERSAAILIKIRKLAA